MNSLDQGFFDHHSVQYLEMALSTDRIERMADPDGYGSKTGDCGDTVEFFLKGLNGMLSSVSFLVNGCVNTLACSNTVAHLVVGKPLKYAWDITPGQVARFLQTLPEDHYHCAQLAVGALYLAMADIGPKGCGKSQK